MSRVDAYPRAVLTVGADNKSVYEASATIGYRSPFSRLSARIRHTEGGFSGSEAVALALGYRPAGTVRPRFAGSIDEDSLRWAPGQVALSASGPLARTQEPTGIEDTDLVPSGEDDPPTDERYAAAWVNATDGTIVAGILALYGITDHNLHDTGTLFATLAPGETSRYAVRLASDQPGWQLIEEIDRITGCRTFDGPDGRVTRVAVTGLPGGSVARTFVQGTDIADGATRERSSQGVYNKVTVTGQSGIAADGTPYTIQASRTKTSPYVPNPPGTREYTFASELIETEALAGEVAARLLAELGRRREDVVIPLAKGDSSIYPGMTVAVTSTALDLDTTYAFRVVEVQDHFGNGGYRTTLVLEGARAAEGTDPNQAPVVAIDYEVEVETTADGDEIAVVTLDSSGSYDPDGDIATRSWSGSPVTPVPIGDDGVRAVAVYDPLTGTPTVTLAVTDTLGKAASATRDIVADADHTYTRELWIAEGDKLAYTEDQETWDEIAVEAVVIPEEAGDDYTLAATAGGTAYRVLPAGTATALSGPEDVTALSISRDPNGAATGVAWAGASDGRVWRSTDHGVTWAAVATLPNAGRCNAIAESPYQPGDVYAGGGHILYHSYDAGASWQAFHTNPDSALAITRLAAGIAPGLTDDPADDQSLMWIGYAAASGSGVDNRVLERAGTLAQDAPSGAAGPLDVTGLTISLDAERLFVTDSGASGRAWTASSTESGDLAPATAYDPGTLGTPRHAIRDGRFPIVWGAGSLCSWKSTDEGASFHRVRDEPAHMIGYGRLVRRVTPVDLTVASEAGEESALYLWNGADNDDPPHGWQFNHFPAASGWGASFASAGAGTPIAGTEKIWGKATPDQMGAETLFRREFDVPAGDVVTATLQVRVDNTILDAYLNGVRLGGPLGDTSMVTTHTFDVADTVIAGTTNVLALRTTELDGGSVTTWVSYKLTIGAG